jgi:Protein kinase domain/Secretin and TonB N terminus short domain
MGEVFLAEDVSLGRQVAIKLVSERVAADPTVISRFSREARLLATIEHPHVVRVYSFGTLDDRPYLVMEYVEGTSLAEHIRRTGPLPFPETLRILRETCEGLDAAQELNIIHRDIKPANILLDRRGRVRVADFGLAKRSAAGTTEGDSSITQAGYLVGSPHYLSPEQAQGESTDHRSDIYSLGVVLYEMITGERPFTGSTPIAVIAKHLHDPLPPVTSKRPDTPAGLVRLVERMTAKNRDERPQSYAELAREIETIGSARSDTAATLAQDFRTVPAAVSEPISRRWRAIAMSGLLFAVLVALSVPRWVTSHRVPGRPAKPPLQRDFVVLHKVVAADVIKAAPNGKLAGIRVILREKNPGTVEVQAAPADLAAAKQIVADIDSLGGSRFFEEPNLFTGSVASQRKISLNGRFVADDLITLFARASGWPVVEDASATRIARTSVPLYFNNAPWDEVVLQLVNQLELSMWRDGGIWIIESKAWRRECEKQYPLATIMGSLQGSDYDAVLASIRPLLSERGVALSSPRLKSIIVADTRERLNTIVDAIVAFEGKPDQIKTLAGVLDWKTRTFLGEKINLSFRDAEIADVIRVFAKLTGFQFVVDPSVEGSVTVDFHEIAWDNALEAILSSQGLTYLLEGKVFRIYPRTRQFETEKGFEVLKLKNEKTSFFLPFSRALAPDVEMVADEPSRTLMLRGSKSEVFKWKTTFAKIDGLQ